MSVDGQGDVSEVSRPLKDKEVGEWILLDGVKVALHYTKPLTHMKNSQTPATCANIALHNLYHGEVDMLVRNHFWSVINDSNALVLVSYQDQTLVETLHVRLESKYTRA